MRGLAKRIAELSDVMTGIWKTFARDIRDGGSFIVIQRIFLKRSWALGRLVLVKTCIKLSTKFMLM